MKRLFTLLMLVCTFMCIPLQMDATVYIRGAYAGGTWPGAKTGIEMSQSGNTYTKEFTSEKDGNYYFRFAGSGWDNEMCPYTNGTSLLDYPSTKAYTISNDCWEGPNGTRSFVVNMTKGTTYVFTVVDGTTKSVACDVKGSSGDDSYTKFYLVGNFDTPKWSTDNTSRPFVTTDGETYTYTFSDLSGSLLFKPYGVTSSGKKFDSMLGPSGESDKAITTEFQEAPYGAKAWSLTAVSGKTYTITLKYYGTTKNPEIKYSEGSATTAIGFTLLNATSGAEIATSSDGTYTLDLTGDGATATSVKLAVGDETWMLADATTVSTSGTSTYSFSKTGAAALTFKAGYKYTLKLTDDGTLTVIATEKGVADGNYYLVGNFFEEDGDNINYDKKYFRFVDNGDGTLTFDMPATLTVKAQVYTGNGEIYGPKDGEVGFGISKTYPTADVKTVDGKLTKSSNYWTFTDRGLSEDGVYHVTITVDADGVPTDWKVDFDKSQRMAYFLADPTELPAAVAHPCYAGKKDDGKSDNKFFSSVYMEANKHFFVIGNIQVYNDDNNTGILYTTNKLYLQGNGGLDITTNTEGQSDGWKYTNVFPNKSEGFYIPTTRTLILEYNPSAGNKQYQEAYGSACHGIAGEVKLAGGNLATPITSIQIVGNGVVDSWELAKAQDLAYNKTLDCWEYTFRTNKSENSANLFRFIANKTWAYNWGEESTNAADQARCPHTSTDATQGHEASEKDPNALGFTTTGTEENRNDNTNTFADMIFNRPAGLWTIRLYLRTESTDGGNYYKNKYWYTITGSASNDVILTYRKDRFIRTYSNDIPMDPDNDNVKIYEVYKYVPPTKVDDIYTQGEVHLRRLTYIPANVGVVLFGEAPQDGKTYKDGDKLAFSLLERTEESEGADGDYRKVWTKSEEYIASNDAWNNYLVPTVQANNKLGNAQVDEDGKILYRYYGLGNYYRTKYHQTVGESDAQEDYLGFFRLTEKGTSGANKAYLSIPANAEVGNGVGATYGYISYNGQFIGNKYDDSTMPTSLAKMSLIFDDLADSGETTGIKEVVEINTDHKYYNLQGMEVVRPTKGVYIHNGKKVIVK